MAIMNDSGDWFAQNAPQGSVLYPNVRGPATASMNPDGSPFTGGITGYGGNPADTSQSPIQASQGPWTNENWLPNGGVTGGKHAVPDGQTGGSVNTPTFPPGTPWWGGVTGDTSGNAPSIPQPTFTAGMTPEQVRRSVGQYYASRGVTPNPTSIDYWTQKYSSPEFNGDINYWQQRLGQADEFTGGGGGNTLAGLGGFGGMVNQLPSAQDTMNMPGFQFAQQQGRDSIQKSAAARGTLLTGNTLKALSDYAQGSALNQAYLPLANLKLGYNQANVNNLYNLANLGQNSSTYGATGRPA